jgi:phosphoenolpyruvate-protein kinase (PTS system EI component)
MAYALIGLGVRQLSVAASGISAVKRIVRGVSTATAAKAAQAALAAATARESAEILRHALRAELGDELLDGLLGLG